MSKGVLDISIKRTLDYLKTRKFYDLVYFLQETHKHFPENSTWTPGHNSTEDDDDVHYEMWREQIALNLPVLYLASLYLHDYVKKNRLKHLLFATRDCVHWHKIYKAMYPDEDVHYFHCSRNMFNAARTKFNPYYDKYIENITKGEIRESVYVDIHGTGQRMYDFFLERGRGGPSCFILSSRHSNKSKLSEGIKDLIMQDRAEFIVFKSIGSSIEMLNYDNIGTCNNYDKNGAVRASLEYDKNIIKPYHDCANIFINLIANNRDRILNSESAHTSSDLKHFIKDLFLPIRDNLPIISKWIEPERHHNI